VATAQMNTVIRHLRRAVLLQDGADRTDGELLASFIEEKDEAAFETLVRRHGPMVLSVCRRIVGNHHDAEDAFQATLLVLARKASSVRPRAMVANWLHGVACRTAMKAKTMTAKRRVREANVTEMPEPEAAPQDQWHDLQPIIDQELSGLPENYRLPIILCDLEGKSIKEATQQLGWPQGTLAGRLARARKLLAKRLTQRGVVLSGGALAVVLAEKAASASVSLSLAVSTTKAAVAIAAGQAAAPSLVSAKVATLMEGVIKGMLLTKLKTVMVVLLMLGVIAFGGSMATRHTATAQQINAEDGKKPAIPKAEKSRRSLKETRLDDDATAQKMKDLPKTLDEQKLHGEWIGKHDGGGKISVFSLIFGPGKTVRRITENGLDDTGTYSVDWSKNPHHLDLKLNLKLPATQTIMEFVEPEKIRIEIGAGDEARPKAFTEETIVLIRKEKHPPGSQEAKQFADRDIKVAEFYRRTGKFGTAHFYYQLVQIRYPGTNFAEKAKQGLEDLKKHRIRFADGSEGWETPAQPGQPQPPAIVQEAPTPGREVHEIRQQVKALEIRLAALEDKGKPQPPVKTDRDAPAYGQGIHELRQQVKNLESRLAAIEAKVKKKGDAEELPKVGTIIVVGNTKLDSVIRKAMQLVPGQILDDKALRIAEKNLAAFDATIEVIDTDNPGFKDILVRVKK
jgi:RNA polymerase sigma factor (sigma-70 family)